MRGSAQIKMSLRQCFWLLVDYRDIWIYPNERTIILLIHFVLSLINNINRTTMENTSSFAMRQ